MRKAVFVVAALLAGARGVAACDEIPAPAERPPADSGSAPGDAADATDAAVEGADRSRCVRRRWRALRNAAPLVEGDAPGTVLLAANGSFEETDDDGGRDRFIYQMALIGRADRFEGRVPVDLASPQNVDPDTCAYCATALARCRQVTAEGITCDDEYRAIGGAARTVKMASEPDAAYWVEAADIVFARVVRSADGKARIDEEDCIVVDRLSWQGYALAIRRPCTPETQVYCRLADTASARGP